MRNEEGLLSIYPAIFALMNAGFTIKQITEDVNQHLNIKITYRQLLYPSLPRLPKNCVKINYF